MTLFQYKLLAAAIVFLIALATTIYPLTKITKKMGAAGEQYAESFQLGEALASGIFLGAALFHLLPDAIQVFAHINPHLTYPVPEGICVIGFMLLLLLERCSLIYAHHVVPPVLVLMLTIHALTEGAALGIGTTFAETMLLFIAIAAHKGSESFALSVTLLRNRMHRKKVGLIIVFFSLMTPFGILLGESMSAFSLMHTKMLTGIFDAFAAGTFLYISTLHHIHFHHHHEEAQGVTEFACFTLGVVVMAGIAAWV